MGALHQADAAEARSMIGVAGCDCYRELVGPWKPSEHGTAAGPSRPLFARVCCANVHCLAEAARATWTFERSQSRSRCKATRTRCCRRVPGKPLLDAAEARRGFVPDGEAAVVDRPGTRWGRPIASSAAAEVAGQPILGTYVRGPTTGWIPEHSAAGDVPRSSSVRRPLAGLT